MWNYMLGMKFGSISEMMKKLVVKFEDGFLTTIRRIKMFNDYVRYGLGELGFRLGNAEMWQMKIYIKDSC